jgi:RecB family exonuclease
MAAELKVSPRNGELHPCAAEFLRRHAGAGEVMVAAPTRDAADDFVRGATEQALVGVHRTTIDYLAAALAQRELTSRGYAPLSAIAREAIAARVIERASEANELTYFEPVAQFPGFPGALARTLTDLRLGGVQPADPDLAHLLERYEAELSSARLADQATRFHTATEIAATGAHVFCGLPLVLLDVPLESRAAREFIAALVARSSAVLVVAQSAVAAEWEQLLGVSAIEIRSEAGTTLASAQQHLFSREIIPTRPADASCRLFSAPGAALEAIEIARTLRDAARHGVPFDTMAILMRRPEQYQPVIEEALRRARISAYFTRGTRRPDISGRAFLALLRCAQERLSAVRFAEYLSLDQAPPGENGEVRAPAGWEKLIVDASVVGDRARWERRLNGLEAELRARYDASDEDKDGATRERLRHKIDNLESLKAFALPLIERLAELPEYAAWPEWLALLHEIADATLRSPGAVHDLLDEFQIMAEAPLNEGSGEPQPVELETVIHALEPHLRFLRETPDDYRYGRVFVGGIEEARAMNFRIVAIPGLNEGDFPRQITGDPLLPDDRKRALGLAVEDEQQEQLLLHTALACASERVIASYSEVDLLSGRKRVLSLYAAELMKAARGSDLDIKKLEEDAGAAQESRAGWPAPRNPADAIDDAEFDLAVLRDAMSPDGKGVGAYLTKVNPHLVRSLRARGRRWREKWFPEDGLVALDIHALKILEQHRLGTRAYSASALQRFAVCPYQFALRAIYGLQPAEQPAALQRMDPAVRGSIFHETQFEFLREMRDLDLLPADQEVLPEMFDALDAALDQVAARYAEKLAPALPYIWNAEVEAIRADLRGWIKRMAETSGDWTPIAFELSFGIPHSGDSHDPHSLAEPVTILDSFQLKGSIDLVERHRTNILRVVDHKTGSAPSPAPQSIGNGEVLQPVLYALAAEQALNEKVVTGRLHYATLRANYHEINIPIRDFTRTVAERALRIIDESLKQGFLPAAPRKDACKKCEYRVVCGPYEEERSARKSKPELKPLRDLRALK